MVIFRHPYLFVRPAAIGPEGFNWDKRQGQMVNQSTFDFRIRVFSLSFHSLTQSMKERKKEREREDYNLAPG